MSGRIGVAGFGGLALVAGLLVAPASGAQQNENWNHANCTAAMTLNNAECTPVFSFTAEAGEKITLTVVNTCAEAFEYTIVPIPVARIESRAAKACTPQKVIEIVHDPKYAGYIVNITRTATGRDSLGNARVTIAVKTSEWTASFGGGFAFSGLRDPAYGLKSFQVPGANGAAATTKYEIIEQPERRDDFGRGVASFVHVGHNSWQAGPVGFAASFGIGVEPDRQGDYYPGISFLLGDKAAITLGAAFGQLKTLPVGRAVKDTVTDANVLGTLGTRRAKAWFIGISYRFLGNGAGDLKKPFLGQGPAGGVGTKSP